ncbi:MAG: NAD(P)-dependent oxidoreductase [Nitrospiraceae bacterium]
MQLALFGTGVLGSAIAERLHRTGHLVTVYNRTIEKALPLRNRGLRVVSRSADAMGSAEAVLLLLADETAIRSVLLQGETAQRLAGRTIIQMGTIGLDQSLELAFEIQRLGGAYMEAPVLGSVTEAAQGTLLVMVGSTPEQFTQWSPMLQALGCEVQRIGPVGSAAVIKLALNQLIASKPLPSVSAWGWCAATGFRRIPSWRSSEKALSLPPHSIKSCPDSRLENTSARTSPPGTC